MIAKPSQTQLDHQRHRNFGVFAHFGVNTFHDVEGSDGSLPAASFNPVHLDCRQWVSVVKRAGASHIILTAKHVDGFCLWPTSTTDYSVASSPWKGGDGDVVRELADACQEAGIGMGLYISPKDRHMPIWGKDHQAYNELYHRQLVELLSGYGKLVEIWFDGYGITEQAYDWDKILEIVRHYQPDAMIFNAAEASIRWIGNEDGLAADPCWYAVTNTGDPAQDDLRAGTKHGQSYMPPECDVPIRDNWFWQSNDLATLKSLRHLQAIWYRSIGLGASLLLNVPPDTSGRLDSRDAERLIEFGITIRDRFANPVPATLQQAGTTITASFDQDVTFDHLVLQEAIADGQIIGRHAISVNGQPIVSNVQTIGSQRVHVFPTVTARTLTIEIDDPEGRLETLEAHLTGITTVPSLEAKQPVAKARWFPRSVTST